MAGSGRVIAFGGSNVAPVGAVAVSLVYLAVNSEDHSHMVHMSAAGNPT